MRGRHWGAVPGRTDCSVFAHCTFGLFSVNTYFYKEGFVLFSVFTLGVGNAEQYRMVIPKVSLEWEAEERLSF